MKLKDLLDGVELLSVTADMEREISSVSYDSRTTRPGSLFVAMTGYAVDGHDFITQACHNGAYAAVCERVPADGVPYIQVRDSRRALALIGANFYGHPADAMTMIGVTGTNGKTTTTYLLRAILQREPGVKVGLIGTNQNMIGDEILPTERTTPESFELQGLFARMRDAGCTHVVMEVSSHALYLERVYGVRYQVGVFTNLTQDHLDFHKTMDAYCDAKAILFRNCEKGVCNADDPWTPRVTHGAKCQLYTFGQRPEADLRAARIELASEYVSFAAVAPRAYTPVRVNIPGAFMVYNTLGALAAAYALGIPVNRSAEALRDAPRVKGRVEVVPAPGKPYTILIDYAHSPDGLENVLRSVKGFAKGRVIAVFGCGGDRDKTKRPKMGAIAVSIADFVVVTTDNPRTESPSDIIADILSGMDGAITPYVVIEDRVRAIHYCMDHAQAGDVIVLCGKGHETYQEIGQVKYPMDERKIVAEYLGATA